MKKIIPLIILLIVSLNGFTSEKAEIIFFYSPHCKACMEVENEIIPRLFNKYKDTIEIRMLNTRDYQNLNLLISILIYK